MIYAFFKSGRKAPNTDSDCCPCIDDTVRTRNSGNKDQL